MSWGNRNDDGYIESSSDDFDNKQYQRDRELRAVNERRLLIASLKHLKRQIEEPDGHPITHVDGIQVEELNLFIERILQ